MDRKRIVILGSNFAGAANPDVSAITLPGLASWQLR